VSKVVLLFVGIALLAISGHYFASLNLSEIHVKSVSEPKTMPTSELSDPPVSRIYSTNKKTPVDTATPPPKLAIPTPVPPKVPEKVSVGDSLRFALEDVVEESLEQELWDEMELEQETTQLTPQNTMEGEIYESESL